MTEMLSDVTHISNDLYVLFGYEQLATLCGS